LLDHLCALWRVKLVSVSTDGENTMMGWLGGFVTLMVKEAIHEVLCVWCPPHQIDLVIKDATCKINDSSFSKITHAYGPPPSTGQLAAGDGQQMPKGHKLMGALPGPAGVAAEASRPAHGVGRQTATRLVANDHILDHRRCHQPARQVLLRDAHLTTAPRHRVVVADGQDRGTGPESVSHGRYLARCRQ